MSPQAYPLQWPLGWPRTEAKMREKAKMRAALSSALNVLKEEIRLFGGSDARMAEINNAYERAKEERGFR